MRAGRIRRGERPRIQAEIPVSGSSSKSSSKCVC
jgi:hypothetical protein